MLRLSLVLRFPSLVRKGSVFVLVIDIFELINHRDRNQILRVCLMIIDHAMSFVMMKSYNQTCSVA